MSISKNRKNIIDNFDTNKIYDPLEAIKLLKENSYVKFDESLEISINLGIDSNKTDQNIRGVINLPKGTGKKIRVAVMAKGDKAKEAIDAGADLVGDDDLAQKVTDGKIEFDQAYIVDLQRLDAMYEVLKQELKKNPSKELKDALTLNLLIRIDLLNNQLQAVEELNDEKESMEQSV